MKFDYNVAINFFTFFAGITLDSIKKHISNNLFAINIALASLWLCSLLYVALRTPYWSAFQMSVFPFSQKSTDTPVFAIIFYNFIQVVTYF